MNMLSLRINAVKGEVGVTCENSQNLFSLEVEENVWPEEQKKQLEAINSADTLENQLKELKSFIRQISSSSLELKIRRKIAEYFSVYYFREKLKHPAKNTIQSCFNQLNQQSELLIDCLGLAITGEIQSLKNEFKIQHFIACLIEASQNFVPMKEAMKVKTKVIIEFLRNFISAQSSNLHSELSPTRKSEISMQIHISVKILIFCIKNSEIKSDEDELIEMSLKLVENVDIPMDLKNNCGLFIALFWIPERSHLVWKYLEDERTSVQKKLAFLFGIANTDFPFSMTIEILEKLKSISESSDSLDPTNMLSIARLFAQISKKFAVETKQKGKMENSVLQYQHFDDFILPFAFNNLDHHIDSVRHLCKEILINFVDFTIETGTVDKLISKYYIKDYENFKIKSIILSLALTKMKNPPVYCDGKRRELMSKIFECDSVNTILINYYEVFAKSFKKTLPFDEWFEKFIIEFLMREVLSENYSVAESLENLCFRLVEKDKKSLQKMIQIRDSIKQKSLIYRIIAKTNKTGAYDNENSTGVLWRNLLPYQEIKNGMMVHEDDKIRTSAFSLIVETRKTTAEFSNIDVECILHFLKYNINVQSPSTRQNILGMLKNLFARIQSILSIVIKKQNQERIEFYLEFLKKLQIFSLDNLFEGANFSRRVLSLRILFYVLEAINEHFSSQRDEIWNQGKFNIAMTIFNDSYEANKQMMIEIMQLIPRNVIKNYNSVTLEQIETLVTSIKPPENLTAAYLIEFYANFLTLEQSDGPEVSKNYFHMLNWCVELLLKGLKVAEKSLIVASSVNPLYGCLYAIRHLMSKLKFETLTKSLEWRQFFQNFISLSHRLTNVVAPVVNSSAPEGILPIENVKGLDENTQREWKEIMERTTPQMILLCSWRTIKETSLLLGDISQRAQTINCDGEGLLTVDNIIDISEHFLDLLSNTKHRGAFEQCFFGFSQLCLRLWTSKEIELHHLPQRQLEIMIQSISGKEDNELLTMKNLCSTRRSAGLPFVIQALVTSELKVGKNSNFHFVMKNLINFAKSSRILESRTHSLNILRALFRCSDLGEPICEYIEDGIKIAIQGYEADSWIERNSSTLLFSALMVRIFGVQKTKDGDELNIRNKMTGRIFFLRYPGLYDFFMNQLKSASEFVANGECNSKLHPLMLILNRLYPSSLEGSESNLKVEKFIPLVTYCSGCVEMQTRVLCAKFIANVLQCEFIHSRIFKLIDFLKSYENLPANISQGILLQIFYLIKKQPKIAIENELCQILTQLSTVAERFKRQLICYSTILDIYLELLMKIPQPMSFNWHEFIDKCNNVETNDVFGIQIVAHKMFLLHSFKNPSSVSFESLESVKTNPEFYSIPYLKNIHEIMQTNTDSNNIIIPLKCDEKWEKRENEKLPKIFHHAKAKHQITNNILNKILMDLDFEYAIEMSDDYEITHQEFAIGRVRKLQQHKNYVNFMIPDDYLLAVKMLDIKAIQELDKNATTSSNSDIVNNLAKLLLNNIIPDHLKKSILKHFNAKLRSLTTIDMIDFDFLPETSTDSSIYVKSVALDVLRHVLQISGNISSLDVILNITKSFLLLLMDDESEIREECASILMKSHHTPIYVQENFLENLRNIFTLIDDSDIFAVILMIAMDNDNGQCSLESNIVDYQVFDKSEVNIFSESFIVKKKCLEILKTKKIDKNDVMNATKKFTKKKSSLQYENFMRDMMSEKSTTL